MAFITDEDYTVQTKSEILNLLDDTEEKTDLRKAERMAIDEIKSYISGRYNVAAIFGAEGEQRDMFLVMIVLDIALYHLWSGRSPRNMPTHRKTRYDDAMAWLVDVGQGDIKTDLPALEGDNFNSEIRIYSKYSPNQNKF
jgi:phage gp36-like protein